MAKYHITQKGEPKICHAKKHCRLKTANGEEPTHYDSIKEAKNAIEKTNKNKTIISINKKTSDTHTEKYSGTHNENNKLPRTEVPVSITPLAGERYYGADIPKETIEDYRKEFSTIVGEKAAAEMEKTKYSRDRGEHYHLTVVTPPEKKNLSQPLTPAPQNPTIKYEGIGKVVEGENEAYFIVCSSPEIQKWREENSLPHKDLHITLGFKNKDVHTKPKDSTSIIAL